eukprot:12916911-Prorocentrum_lima.AAC.1
MTKRKDVEVLANCSRARERLNTFDIAGPNCAPSGSARHIEDYILPSQSLVTELCFVECLERPEILFHNVSVPFSSGA